MIPKDMEEIKKRILKLGENINIKSYQFPEENCPSFEKCNTNKCPLHKDYDKLIDSPEDKKIKGWKKCRTKKEVRKRIGMIFDLKNKGLTYKELDSLRKSIALKKMIAFHTDKNDKLGLKQQNGRR